MKNAARLMCMLVLLGACGKKADDKPAAKTDDKPVAKAAPLPQGDPKPSGEQKPTPVCAWLTEADATAVLGAPAKYVSDTPMDPEVDECEVTTDTDDKPGEGAMLSRMEADAYDQLVAQVGAQDSKPEAVAGVGEKAMWIGSEVMSRIVVQKGDRTIVISVHEPFGKAGPKDKTVALAQKIVARM